MSLAIAAVVLNHRTADDTILAVRSLKASDTGVHIIVVDNGSADDSLARLRQIPGVDVIELRHNLGFSAGCNAGIERALAAGAGAVLLINSDVIVPPDAIGALSAVLAQDRSVGIVGPVVRQRSSPDVIESAGIRYDLTTGRMRLIEHRVSTTALPPFAVRAVDAVSGCAMLVRREVFEAVGRLEADYYFGFEDLDFCLRARQRGFNTACCGSAFVLHEGHRSIGRQSARRTYYATRNHLLLAARHPLDRTRWQRRVRLMRVLALNLAYAIKGEDVPRLHGVYNALAGAMDFMRGRAGR